MKTNEILNEYYDEEEDEYTVINIDHKRRPRITLRHLQKLRKTRGMEELENKQRLKDIAKIYGRPEGDEGGPPIG